jgi:hypothetical protein
LEKKKQPRGRTRTRRKKKETNERKDLTLTGLLMEGLEVERRDHDCRWFYRGAWNSGLS